LPLLIRDIAGIIRPVHGYGSVVLDLIRQGAESQPFHAFWSI
jgi:hypothetical protein